MRNITLTWHQNAGNLIAGPQFGGDNGLVQGIALGRANLEAPSLNSLICPREPPFPFLPHSCMWHSFSQLKLHFDNSISFYFLDMLYWSEISLVTSGQCSVMSVSICIISVIHTDGLAEETYFVTLLQSNSHFPTTQFILVSVTSGFVGFHRHSITVIVISTVVIIVISTVLYCIFQIF